jgi:hypothetical protein
MNSLYSAVKTKCTKYCPTLMVAAFLMAYALMTLGNFCAASPKDDICNGVQNPHDVALASVSLFLVAGACASLLFAFKFLGAEFSMF